MLKIAVESIMLIFAFIVSSTLLAFTSVETLALFGASFAVYNLFRKQDQKAEDHA